MNVEHDSIEASLTKRQESLSAGSGLCTLNSNGCQRRP